MFFELSTCRLSTPQAGVPRGLVSCRAVRQEEVVKFCTYCGDGNDDARLQRSGRSANQKAGNVKICLDRCAAKCRSRSTKLLITRNTKLPRCWLNYGSWCPYKSISRYRTSPNDLLDLYNSLKSSSRAESLEAAVR
jgi:hypothetical protein